MSDVILRLIQEIAGSPQILERTPEASAVMDTDASVNDFDKVMRTNLTVNYAAGLDYIYRARNSVTGAPLAALDLCAGPGHFTQCLETFLDYQTLLGIDLSSSMVERAQANAKKSKSRGAVSFQCRDVLEINDHHARYDLVTFTNAAHHFDSIEAVRAVLDKADQLCRNDGLIVLTDLCRLPTAETTEKFTKIIGQDYMDSGLPALANDFKASMLAAWSAEELMRARPLKSSRCWYQVVAGDLPFFQALIGLPKGRSDLFLRPSFDWTKTGIHQTDTAKRDWQTMRGCFYSGLQRLIEPVKDQRSPATKAAS